MWLLMIFLLFASVFNYQGQGEVGALRKTRTDATGKRKSDRGSIIEILLIMSSTRQAVSSSFIPGKRPGGGKIKMDRKRTGRPFSHVRRDTT